MATDDQELPTINTGWRKASEPRKRKVTRKLAAEHYALPPLRGDRQLDMNRVARHRKQMQAHSFRPATWATAYVHETQTLYRMNGNHTSYALMSWLPEHGPFPDLDVWYETYGCDTLLDAAALYATFDSGADARKASDVNRTTIANDDEMNEWLNTTDFKLVVSALGYSPKREFETGTTQADKAKRPHDEIPFCKWLVEKILYQTVKGDANYKEATVKRKSLARMAVVNVMYQTYKMSVRKATDFWSAVREETDPDTKSGSRRLANFLKMASLTPGRTGKVRAQIPTNARECYYKSIVGWNAFVDGVQTDLRYFPQAEKQPVLKNPNA